VSLGEEATDKEDSSHSDKCHSDHHQHPTPPCDTEWLGPLTGSTFSLISIAEGEELRGAEEAQTYDVQQRPDGDDIL
jgi:hypothetical protein